MSRKNGKNLCMCCMENEWERQTANELAFPPIKLPSHYTYTNWDWIKTNHLNYKEMVRKKSDKDKEESRKLRVKIWVRKLKAHTIRWRSETGEEVILTNFFSSSKLIRSSAVLLTSCWWRATRLFLTKNTHTSPHITLNFVPIKISF